MAAKDELGRAGEEVAADYLVKQRHIVLDRNWRCADGEIDIVTMHSGTIVIVEVKTRRSMAFGDPLEAVDARKLARLWRLARAWIQEHPEYARSRSIRVDIVGITGGDPLDMTIAHLEDVR